MPLTDYINAATWAIKKGAQVLNFSFGVNVGQDYLDFDCQPIFATNNEQPFCAFARLTDYLDVTVVAASGNVKDKHVAHPSGVPNIISVGATQSMANGSGNYLWATAGQAGSNFGPEMVAEGVVAPGFNILSTTYIDRNWSPSQSCGDSYGNGPILSDGYGMCTGTSMAAPFVSGIAGLIKTVNPLQTATQVRTRMLDAGTLHNLPSNNFGHGFVDANMAVTSAISEMQYRLTPLFALSSANQKDYFYTVVPQHVRAAYLGTLSPQVTGNGVPGFYSYTFVGTNVAPGGTTYTIGVQPPATRITPKAQAWVFSTHADPRNASWELAPLWRMSYKCGDPIPSGRPNICAAFPYHIDHFYTTDVGELITFKNSHGYLPDGIEGYVYPVAGGQPAGTAPLLRAFKAADDDYAIFPQNQQASMAALGYTGSVTTLGYVYANTTGARPTY